MEYFLTCLTAKLLCIYPFKSKNLVVWEWKLGLCSKCMCISIWEQRSKILSAHTPGADTGWVLGVTEPPPLEFWTISLFTNERRMAYNTAAKWILWTLVKLRNDQCGCCVIVLAYTTSRGFRNSCFNDCGIIFEWSRSSLNGLRSTFVCSIP